MFGRTDIVLHTADIARNRNGFEELQNSEFRTRFYGELNSLMERLRYEVVACAVRKEDYFARYGAKDALNKNGEGFSGGYRGSFATITRLPRPFSRVFCPPISFQQGRCGL